MASGWNLWVWLQCIGVASQCCYKEVYRYPHNNSLHPRVRKRNFPCNDDNVAFMQQVHSKTTGKQSVLLIV